jgi:hypothetical protein
VEEDTVICSNTFGNQNLNYAIENLHRTTYDIKGKIYVIMSCSNRPFNVLERSLGFEKE